MTAKAATTVARKSATTGKASAKPAAGSPTSGPGRPNTFSRRIRTEPGIFSTIPGYGTDIAVVDLAEIFGVTTNAVRRWIKSGYLPAPVTKVSYGRKLYLKVDDVLRAMKKATGS